MLPFRFIPPPNHTQTFAFVECGNWRVLQIVDFSVYLLFCPLSEQIAANISMEIKRMQRRKQLHYPGTSSPPPQQSEGAMAIDSLSCSPSSSTSSFFNALSPSKKETPLFTFRQVGMICERMLRERETQIKEDYDRVLTSKLAGENFILKCGSDFFSNKLLC